MPKIWPISDLYFPLVHVLNIGAKINPFGSGFEQRITTDIPRGPRSDGEGGQSIYVGQNVFRINTRNLKYKGIPYAANVNIENNIRKLWQFYKSCFYDPNTGRVMWEPFYFYNLTENDNISTWTGDTVNNGVNSVNDPVSNVTGRYLMRFDEPSMSITRFRSCLFSSSLILIEVDA